MRNHVAHALSIEPSPSRSTERVLRETFWRTQPAAPRRGEVVALESARRDKPRPPSG